MVDYFKKQKLRKQILEQMGYEITYELKDISEYKFPDIILQRTKEELRCTDEELEVIQTALLHYFMVVKEHKQVEMIDEKADTLWHMFLLDTKEYMKFCSQYIGFYVHHNPYKDKKKLSKQELDTIKCLYRKQLQSNPSFKEKRVDPITKSFNDSNDVSSFTNSNLPYLIILTSILDTNTNENSSTTSARDSALELINSEGDFLHSGGNNLHSYRSDDSFSDHSTDTSQSTYDSSYSSCSSSSCGSSSACGSS